MTTKVILFFWCYKSFYEKLLRIVDSDGSWEMGDGSWEMEVGRWKFFCVTLLIYSIKQHA
jgi:hypothetical protein